MRSRIWLAIGALALAACGDDKGHPDGHVGIDAETDGPPAVDARTDTIQATGLCDDPGCMTIAAGILVYTPQGVLWSDTATKARWILLPAGLQIDTTDMDYWEFPMGTKIWKEFTRGPTRVETRLIEKVGPLPDDWEMTPYIWNAAQDLAIATPQGMDDANGTMHDVPSRAECRQCHDRSHGDVLGFSAIQLDAPAAAGEIDLDDLIAMNALTAPPSGAIPHFPVPGNADEQAVLKYMHANCGHCHNPTSDVFTDITDIDLRMRVGLLASADVTPAWTSTINQVASPPINGALLVVHGQDLADSVLYQRFITTNVSQHMPKLGSEMTDPAGQLLIETWINGLPP